VPVQSEPSSSPSNWILLGQFLSIIAWVVVTVGGFWLVWIAEGTQATVGTVALGAFAAVVLTWEFVKRRRKASG
jgi:hypothetical protein